MFCLILCVTIFVASHSEAVAVISTREAAKGTVSWESHGRNDLREWRSTLLKGSQYFKTDFNWQSDPYTCLWQRRMKNVTSDGCFVLEHTYINTTRDYNTSWDIVDFISDAANRPLLTGSNWLKVQMCLKNKPALCDGSHAAAAWSNVMTDFYNAATAAIATYALNVDFIFDGFGQESDQTCSAIQKWRPWVSTWDAYPADAAGLDNNASNGDDRFQMMNVEGDDADSLAVWKEYAKDKYYKFINSSYAFVAWEPSNQADMEAVTETYLQSGVVHTPGFRIAYNGDPVMFKVFMANMRSEGTHQIFGQEFQAMPLVASMTESLLLALSFGPMPNSPPQYALIRPLAKSVGKAQWEASGIGNLTGFPFLPIVALSFMGPGQVLATSGNGSTSVLSLSSDGARVVFTSAVQNAPNGTLHAVNNTKSTLLLNVYTPQIAFAEADGDRNCTLWARLLGSPVKTSWCLFQDMYAENYTIATILNETSMELRILFATTVARQVFGNVVVVDLNTRKIAWRASPEAKFLAIGQSPALSVDAVSGTVLLVFGNSVCWNSLLKDDDVAFYSGLMVCDIQNRSFVEFSKEPLLSYAYASLAAFIDLLATRPVLLNGALSWCDDKVLTGSYDMGYNPSVVLLPGGVVVAVHTSTSAEQSSECGMPTVGNASVMLDAWGF